MLERFLRTILVSALFTRVLADDNRETMFSNNNISYYSEYAALSFYCLWILAESGYLLSAKREARIKENSLQNPHEGDYQAIWGNDTLTANKSCNLTTSLKKLSGCMSLGGMFSVIPAAVCNILKRPAAVNSFDLISGSTLFIVASLSHAMVFCFRKPVIETKFEYLTALFFIAALTAVGVTGYIFGDHSLNDHITDGYLSSSSGMGYR